MNDTSAPVPRSNPLSEEERRKILEVWNNRNHDFPEGKCNHELFEEHVQRTPDAPALFYGEQRLTYRELDGKANQLARHLQAMGVGPDSLVGISIERSLELVIGLLGVVKAGGAYVPLDPAYPKERLAHMMEDAKGLEILLTKEYLTDRLPEHQAEMILLDKDWGKIDARSTEKPFSGVTVYNLVYVIFTSGSTGRAKGAAVFHRGWTNLLNWFVTEFSIDSSDKVLIISSFNFDITQRSLAMPLVVGGELHLLASDLYDPYLINDTVAGRGITLINCSPSTFYPLIETGEEGLYEKLKTLRGVYLGGEPVSASRLREWGESDESNIEMVNVYGVAECTDVASFYILSDYKKYVEKSVPMGIPIFNFGIYILDETLNLLPVGVSGEICLGGDGVGRGYLSDAALTAAKFVPDPFNKKPGSRLYRTGDLGRFLPDGNIEFIGRMDYQVKVRGFRVDMGDIESTMRQHEAVNEAIVVHHEYRPNDKRLVAYFVPEVQLPNNEGKQEEIDPPALMEELKQFLLSKLPDYMEPSAFVMLEEFPLSPNGKIDRRALPDPQEAAINSGTDFEPPRDEKEEKLLEVFLEHLKIPGMGIHDNFFDIGGHSLMATEIIARVNEIYKLRLTQTDMLIDPTISGLAGRLEKDDDWL
ncbi:MAG: amino acid adenylation domain-containing protein [bacterium]|nr:amino acid adenylation domain-containing protein [bacterium]